MNETLKHDWLPLIFWAITSPALVLFWGGVSVLAWKLL